MPHAGGRVGRGLYFADMISKSEQYLGLHGDIVSNPTLMEQTNGD